MKKIKKEVTNLQRKGKQKNTNLDQKSSQQSSKKKPSFIVRKWPPKKVDKLITLEVAKLIAQHDTNNLQSRKNKAVPNPFVIADLPDHRVAEVLLFGSSRSPKPHPSKPHPCNMPQAKTEVALQFSECYAAESGVALANQTKERAKRIVHEFCPFL